MLKDSAWVPAPLLLLALCSPGSQEAAPPPPATWQLTQQEGLSGMGGGDAAVLAAWQWLLEEPGVATQLWEGAWNGRGSQSGNGARRRWGRRRGEAEEGVRRPTSILGLDGDDPLTLWTKALGGLGLHLELVGHVLTEAWHCQSALRVVTIHQERGSWL